MVIDGGGRCVIRQRAVRDNVGWGCMILRVVGRGSVIGRHQGCVRDNVRWFVGDDVRWCMISDGSGLLDIFNCLWSVENLCG